MSSQPKEVLASRCLAGTGDSLAAMAPRFECKTKAELAALVLEKFVACGGVMPGEGLVSSEEVIRVSLEPAIRDAMALAVDHSPAYARGSETSKAAAESIAEAAPAIRQRILERIAASPNGMTCDEVEIAMGLSHQTASARVHELAKMGKIEGLDRRPTRSGRNAVVWFAAKEMK